MPGLGYLYNGDKRSFYKTVIFFFSVIIIDITLRLVVSFGGLVSLVIFLTVIYIFTSIDATLKAKSATSKRKNTGYLKFISVLSFLLATGLTFANRRTIMGVDILSMDVPVLADDPKDQQVYKSKIVTDLSVSYDITKMIQLTVGANNLLDVYPDKTLNPDYVDNGRFLYSGSAHQFGANGRFVFTKLNFSF